MIHVDFIFLDTLLVLLCLLVRATSGEYGLIVFDKHSHALDTKNEI